MLVSSGSRGKAQGKPERCAKGLWSDGVGCACSRPRPGETTAEMEN